MTLMSSRDLLAPVPVRVMDADTGTGAAIIVAVTSATRVTHATGMRVAGVVGSRPTSAPGRGHVPLPFTERGGSEIVRPRYDLASFPLPRLR